MKTFCSALLCTLITTVSIAQTNPKVQDTTTQKVTTLDEVIVTGNLKTDPIHTIVTNNYDETIVQPKNVADLFNDINGFSVIKRGNYAIDPSFRASQYEQLNVQYDGGTKAMHACPNRMDPITTHVIPEEISKIEIIKGPYTVRYGATFGGIVNLVTQKPNYLDKGFHGKASAGYETNGNSMVNMLQLQYIEDKYDIVGNVGYRDFGSYEDGNGVEIPSSFRSTDYGVKLGYNFTDNQRLQAHWRQSFGRDVQHAALMMDTEYDDSSILSLDYKISDLGETVKSFSAKAYYSYVDHLMTNFDRPSFVRMTAESSVESTTIGGKLELNWQPAKNLTVFSGLDAMTIARDGGRTRTMKLNMMGMPLAMPMVFNDKVWQDSYINDYGVFTEAKWAINPTTVLTAGMRYDLVKSDIQDPEDDFAARYDLEEKTDNNVSGTVSIKRLVTNNFTLEAAYGRGVRSANMIERYINHFTVGQDPYEYLGNPNLKPEVNNQFEVGFKGKNSKNNFNYAASFYYSKFENYIVAVVDPTITRKYMPTTMPQEVKVFRNLDNAYKTGFEAMAQVIFLNDFYFKTELAYVYAKNNDLGESLPLTPPLNSTFSLGLDREKYWAKVQYNVTSKQENIAESFGETTTAGYETLDVKLGIKPLKNLTLGVAALNIFDEAYNNHLNFSFTNQADFGRTPITEPGRNFSAFVQYQF
ncbi:TonB-dependent receptor domain-containing protein [Mesoflavibacter sp. SCSIO 43206]|uniref:TonB-dependent receptor domain-containing protein n=1 Tax=Mesoflavibacter sp. SCSIO 43206 TaxID=2779362 RepID=UPI001CA99C55|nr:TonB-dependent receptor [Mesoflavibacter sp. SCSIO 43206]UAB74920.1 TonB-dependent receptor [Mesoflavibacter sp. SCSIO 43206]